MLFDTHVHLNDVQFEPDRDKVIQRAQEVFGVTAMINVGFNRETIQQTLDLVSRYECIYAAVGWHPQEANQFTDQDLDYLRSLTKHPKVVALGEMGLDYYRDYAPKKVQKGVFRKQIGLARETELPIIIHNRDAHEDVIRILKEEQAQEVGGVMHCFSGDERIMEQALELGFYIGLGGPVTFRNAHLPKTIARIVPLDRLLIETDCPYLAPHPYRGKRNETGYVRLVAEAIAELRGISLQELARKTTENACRLFRIPSISVKDV